MIIKQKIQCPHCKADMEVVHDTEVSGRTRIVVLVHDAEDGGCDKEVVVHTWLKMNVLTGTVKWDRP